MAQSPTGTIVLCVDGSDSSVQAVAAGFALLPRDSHVVIATVVEPSDPSLVMGGGGHAGGIMTSEEFERHEKTPRVGRARDRGASRRSDRRRGTGDTRRRRRGGPRLCDLAVELSARALVLGTRGRGGIKRALLGSVSDYVVRNAPCPVVITAVNS